MSTMNHEVHNAIQSERDYQDKRWGPPTVRRHEVGAWLALMQVYLTRAQWAWGSDPDDQRALVALRKVLALGVACGEQHGLPLREPGEVVSKRDQGGAA